MHTKNVKERKIKNTKMHASKEEPIKNIQDNMIEKVGATSLTFDGKTSYTHTHTHKP